MLLCRFSSFLLLFSLGERGRVRFVYRSTTGQRRQASLSPAVPPPSHYSKPLRLGPTWVANRPVSVCMCRESTALRLGGKVFLFSKKKKKKNGPPLQYSRTAFSTPNNQPLNNFPPIASFLLRFPSVCGSMLHFSLWLHFDSVAARACGLPVCCLCARASPCCGGVM